MRGLLSNGRPSRGTLLGLLGVLALVVATGGVALAAIPGTDRTLTACVASGGALKVIDAEAGEQCKPNQATVTLAVTDPAGKVSDSELLDGKDSTDFLGAEAKAADADRLDGRDSTDFLGAGAKAADADLLDGRNSTDFLGAGAKATDADRLDGLDSSAFLRTTAKATDADRLDGLDSSAFIRSANIVMRTADTTLNDGSANWDVANCQSGERAVGGGVQLVGTAGPTFDANSPVLFSRPHFVANTVPVGWWAGMRNETGTSKTMRVYVICAS
jgi:hypothetical protein